MPLNLFSIAFLTLIHSVLQTDKQQSLTSIAAKIKKEN